MMPCDSILLPSALRELLGTSVRKMDELTGPAVREAVAGMQPGDVMLLENSRFDPREKKNDPELAAELAQLADVYVDDAFGAAHRAHATTAGVAALLPAVAGLLMEKELAALGALLSEPKRPFVVVLGGAKVTDKIRVIERFLDLADELPDRWSHVLHLHQGQGRRGRSVSGWRTRPAWRIARALLAKAAGSHCA